MAIIKCKMCGGDLTLSADSTTAVCEYCGSAQTVPKVDDEKKINLFARANRLRAACDFDKAAGLYEAIAADFPEEAEAYWGLVLCKYGIEYVDDPATGKKIPTCHRSDFESVMKDSNVELAQEYADVAARRLYREEAKQIEELRKGIIAVSAAEEPYDIFICYKETDFDGKRTLDSVLAQDIYDALTDKGYRVFFSRISLEDKLGTEYEPYIFAALNSAKIMLVVGTDFEYFNAVWVKNEWSRFLKLMAKDKGKYLIPCFKGIDAYDMPEKFARLQAQDLDKMGATQDIVRGVQKLLPRQSESVKETVKETVVVQQAANPTVDSYLKRAFLFLEDGDWSSADEYCEKVLDIDPENAVAYLSKLMADLHVSKREDLQNLKSPFDDHAYFKKTLRFADNALRDELRGYAYCVKKRIEDERIAEEKRAEEKRIAEEKRAEEKRIAAEKRWEQIKLICRGSVPVQQMIYAGTACTAGIKRDGTVVTTGRNEYSLRNVLTWRDIMSVQGGTDHLVGLRMDGTVTADSGDKDALRKMSTWKDIAFIAVGDAHTVGLKKDGTVVAAGRNVEGQCDVSNWRDVAAIAAGGMHTVGLKADGTVVTAGCDTHGQCRVCYWRNIIAVSAGRNHTALLKADGTVAASGDNEHGQCNVSDWNDIVAISAGSMHTVGVKKDGTVVAAGWNSNGQCDVSDWHDIIAVSAGQDHTVGLKEDGTVVVAGNDACDWCNVSGWKLFDNLEHLEEESRVAREKLREEDRKREEERIAREKREEEEYIAGINREKEKRMKRAEEGSILRAERRKNGLCQLCGGELKGLFAKKCVNCGMLKDY